jgi:hypothetical protein
MPKILLSLLVVCLLFSGFILAGPPVHSVVHSKIKADTSVIRLDTTHLTVRVFNADSIKAYQKNPRFQYHDDLSAKGTSLWTRFWMWFWQVMSRLFSFGPLKGHSFEFLKYVFFVLAAGFVVFIIFKVLGIDMVRMFRRESRAIDIPYSESLENIHHLNFDAEIEKAIGGTNYKLAVRLLYLRSLKQLNDAGLIQWKLDKTNADYLAELRNSNQYQLFTDLTRRFEYIWYGNFYIDGNVFQSISSAFYELKRTLP